MIDVKAFHPSMLLGKFKLHLHHNIIETPIFNLVIIRIVAIKYQTYLTIIIAMVTRKEGKSSMVQLIVCTYKTWHFPTCSNEISNLVLAEKIKIKRFNSLCRDEGCFYVTLKPLLSLINKQYTENTYVDNVRSNI